MSREDKRAEAREQRRAESAAAAATGTSDTASSASTRPDRESSAPKRANPKQFVGEVRSELRKVAWPSRHEVVVYTITVLVVTTMLTLLVYGMDYIFRQAATQFL